jgi:putative transposase
VAQVALQPGSTGCIIQSTARLLPGPFAGSELSVQSQLYQIMLMFMSDKRREFTNQRYVFLLTFSVYRRRRLLQLDHPKRIVLGVLNHQLEQMEGKCIGFVIMPDHIHVLLWLPDPQDLRRFVHGWKRMSSFEIRLWYAVHAPNYFEEFGPGDRFWQPKSDCFHTYSAAKIHEKLDSIHLNPPRAGLVQRAVDWRWSSARWYLEHRSVGVPISWIEC